MGRNRRLAAAFKDVAMATVRMDTEAWAMLEREAQRRLDRLAALNRSRAELEALDDAALVKRLEGHTGISAGPIRGDRVAARAAVIDMIQSFEVPLA